MGSGTMVEEKVLLEVGPYEIRRMHNGNLWISREGGEGMEVKQDWMLALMDKLWADYF